MFGLYWPIRVSLFFTLLLFSQCRSRGASSQPGSLSPSSTDQASVALDAKPAASLVGRLLPEVQQIFAKRAKQLQKDSKLVEEVRNGVGELIEQLKQPADLAVQKLAIIGDLGRGGVVKQWDVVRSVAEELVKQLKQARLEEAQCTASTLVLQLRVAIAAACNVLIELLGTKDSDQLGEALQAVEEWRKKLEGALREAEKWRKKLLG